MEKFSIAQKLSANRDIGIIVSLGRSYIDRISPSVALFLRFCGKLTRLHIAECVSLFSEVHGNHRELRGCSALHEKHFIIIGNFHDFSECSLGLCENFFKGRRSVAHLHDGTTGAWVAKKLFLGFFENLKRHHAWASRKIINSVQFFVHFYSLLNLNKQKTERRLPPGGLHAFLHFPEKLTPNKTLSMRCRLMMSKKGNCVT